MIVCTISTGSIVTVGCIEGACIHDDDNNREFIEHFQFDNLKKSMKCIDTNTKKNSNTNGIIID